MTVPHPLDNPVLSSLTGPHSRWAERCGNVPEMLELTARTKPGPFLPRTAELGTYLGIRRQGRLVAMGGERLHPAGWTEISAVCTDEAWRGQGLAARLILAVGAGIRARGEIPFLHALATNTAIGLYQKLGFRHRRALLFAAARVPEAQPPDPARSADLVTDQDSGALRATEQLPRRTPCSRWPARPGLPRHGGIVLTSRAACRFCTGRQPASSLNVRKGPEPRP